MKLPNFVLSLPAWTEDFQFKSDIIYPTVEDRMRLVIELSKMNVQHGTGGPFGAAIFDTHTNKLISFGVNLVISSYCSAAHAEIVAIIIAQQLQKNYDLGSEGSPSYELVSSVEPCAMCFGAISWSGIRRLVCGARGEDAHRIGFDEGPKMKTWVKELEVRDISVLQDVCRKEAVSVLNMYQKSGGLIYNARQGSELSVSI